MNLSDEENECRIDYKSENEESDESQNTQSFITK